MAGFATPDASDRQCGIGGYEEAVILALFAPRDDDDDDDSRASRLLHLHNTSTRIVPGHDIGVCLRIRRFRGSNPFGRAIGNNGLAALKRISLHGANPSEALGVTRMPQDSSNSCAHKR